MDRRELMKGAAAAAVAVALPMTYPRQIDVLITAFELECMPPPVRKQYVWIRNHEGVDLDAAWFRCV